MYTYKINVTFKPFKNILINKIVFLSILNKLCMLCFYVGVWKVTLYIKRTNMYIYHCSILAHVICELWFGLKSLFEPIFSLFLLQPNLFTTSSKFVFELRNIINFVKLQFFIALIKSAKLYIFIPIWFIS